MELTRQKIELIEKIIKAKLSNSELQAVISKTEEIQKRKTS